MARAIGPGGGSRQAPRNAAPRNSAPRQQQMQRAFGAPQARPAGQSGVPHPDRARPRSAVQQSIASRQRRTIGGQQGTGAMGSTIDVGRYFGDTGAGGGASSQSALKCNDCGTGLMAGYDAQENPDGMGYLCKNCWSDMWVPHAHGNLPSLAGTNTCTMGIRWTPQEWTAIQGIVTEAINSLGTHLGRYPTSNDYSTLSAIVNPILERGFKRSVNCRTCKADVVFYPKADDIPMIGINTQG